MCRCAASPPATGEVPSRFIGPLKPCLSSQPPYITAILNLLRFASSPTNTYSLQILKEILPSLVYGNSLQTKQQPSTCNSHTLLWPSWPSLASLLPRSQLARPNVWRMPPSPQLLLAEPLTLHASASPPTRLPSRPPLLPASLALAQLQSSMVR